MNATATRRSVLQLVALFLSFAVVFAVGQWLIAAPGPDDGQQHGRDEGQGQVVVLNQDGQTVSAKTDDGDDTGLILAHKIMPIPPENGGGAFLCVTVPQDLRVERDGGWKLDPGMSRWCNLVESGGTVELRLVAK